MGWDRGCLNADDRQRNGGHLFAVPRGVERPCTPYPTAARSPEDILSGLSMAYYMESEEVAEEQWQRVGNEQQRQLAERKLDGWLVKPTDGIFARANRTISIPISRRIIPFPITPNMVSLFTLGVSFAAGVFLALGGYWNMLTGAVLSWFSSVLDGCDGEVARLKLQESAFGCWLETICDNLYYLFIFGGMTIGLVRSSGNRSYLVWGGLLLFGAIMSFLMTGLQRHQMTNKTAGTVFARVAQESGQPEFESSLVSRAAYGIHHPALLLALCHPVFCSFAAS